MPTSEAREDEIEEIYKKIKKFVKLTNGKENLIIMGNWNAIVGKGQTVKKLVGMDSAHLSNSADINHDLVTSNTLFKNHKKRRYTYHNNQTIPW